jgi:acyl dehydratase
VRPRLRQVDPSERVGLVEADIVAFGGISGDYFYMHFDEIAAKESPFGKRILARSNLLHRSLK